MKYFVLLIIITGIAYGFNPPPFLGGGKTNADPNQLNEQEKANIEALIRGFNNISEEDKRKLARFRKEYRRLSEQLNELYETLPDDVKTLLKQERRIRATLSPRGLHELDSYITPPPKSE